MGEMENFKWLFDGLEMLKERFAGEPKAIEALEAVRLWVTENGLETVDLYRWNGKKHVLVATMTVEEARAFDLAMQEKTRAVRLEMQEKAKRTKARRKRIREIIRENRFSSFEDALSYVLNGGESTEIFRENMEKDRSYWMQELMLMEREQKENAGKDGN